LHNTWPKSLVSWAEKKKIKDKAETNKKPRTELVMLIKLFSYKVGESKQNRKITNWLALGYLRVWGYGFRDRVLA
jgi:hypothetical protein